jgi:hypothetical protein
LAILPLMWVSRGTPVTHLKRPCHQLTAISHPRQYFSTSFLLSQVLNIC